MEDEYRNRVSELVAACRTLRSMGTFVFRDGEILKTVDGVVESAEKWLEFHDKESARKP